MKSWGSVLLIVLAVFAAGCSDDVKHQELMRGRWLLESRTLADGTTLTPPEFAGILEWFPLSQNRAYTTLVISQSEDDLNFTGATYTIDAASFVRDEYSRLGTGYIATTWTADKASSRSEGRYTSDGQDITFEHEDGTRFEYDAEGLTVTHSNGVVDRWAKDADVKGLLAN